VALAIVRDLIGVLFRSRAAVIAENLFLRQLALYQERKTRRSRPTSAAKFALVILGRFLPWASALAIVKPDTFVRWHEPDSVYSGAGSLGTLVMLRYPRTYVHPS
jgi:hypothetical protein